jgi:hypothetical protein
MRSVTTAARAAMALALTTSICPAAAQNGADLFDKCYVRTYDAAHLEAHPKQKVAAIQAYFQQYEDNLWAGVYYTLRDKKKYAFSGDCYDAVPGGFLCHVCANDSCDQTGETFKVMWSDPSAVDLVNDTTGVAGQDVNGKPNKLAPKGEEQTFRLQPATGDQTCDWQGR